MNSTPATSTDSTHFPSKFPISRSNEICVFDVETTIPNEIIEFGCIVLDKVGWFEKFSYSTLIKPVDYPIDRVSESIHGISARMLVSSPTFDQVADEIYSVLHGRCWLGHNIQGFDCVQINKAFNRIGRSPPVPSGIIDTLKLVRTHFQGRAPNNKLDSLSRFFGLGDERHRAIADCRQNIEVIKNVALTLFCEQQFPAMFNQIDEIPMSNGVSSPELKSASGPPIAATKVEPKEQAKEKSANKSNENDNVSKLAEHVAAVTISSPTHSKPDSDSSNVSNSKPYPASTPAASLSTSSSTTPAFVHSILRDPLANSPSSASSPSAAPKSPIASPKPSTPHAIANASETDKKSVETHKKEETKTGNTISSNGNGSSSKEEKKPKKKKDKETKESNTNTNSTATHTNNDAAEEKSKKEKVKVESAPAAAAESKPVPAVVAPVPVIANPIPIVPVVDLLPVAVKSSPVISSSSLSVSVSSSAKSWSSLLNPSAKPFTPTSSPSQSSNIPSLLSIGEPATAAPTEKKKRNRKKAVDKEAKEAASAAAKDEKSIENQSTDEWTTQTGKKTKKEKEKEKPKEIPVNKNKTAVNAAPLANNAYSAKKPLGREFSGSVSPSIVDLLDSSMASGSQLWMIYSGGSSPGSERLIVPARWDSKPHRFVALVPHLPGFTARSSNQFELTFSTSKVAQLNHQPVMEENKTAAQAQPQSTPKPTTAQPAIPVPTRPAAPVSSVPHSLVKPTTSFASLFNKK